MFFKLEHGGWVVDEYVWIVQYVGTLAWCHLKFLVWRRGRLP